MNKNIYFIGGIHGAGKGTICKQIVEKLDIVHLTASEVLKWSDISEKENKIVQDIDLTQDLLITNLMKMISQDKQYLLDGHYCLLNRNNEPERINMFTFSKLKPRLFIVVIEDVFKVKERLEKRDKREYDIDFLKKFQQLEIEYSEFLSNELNIPLIKIVNGNLDNLLKFILNESIA
jgi:adenylate kinase